MSTPDRHDTTELLAAMRRGDANAIELLFQLLYDELRGPAHRNRRTRDTLNTTEIVHELYKRWVKAGAPKDVQDRKHLFCLAAKVMQQILIDRKRVREAKKRGGGAKPVPLDEEHVPADNMLDAVEQRIEIIALREALDDLEMQSPEGKQQCDFIRCHWFLGMTQAEIAEQFGVSTGTVHNILKLAKAFLRRRLEE